MNIEQKNLVVQFIAKSSAAAHIPVWVSVYRPDPLIDTVADKLRH